MRVLEQCSQHLTVSLLIIGSLSAHDEAGLARHACILRVLVYMYVLHRDESNMLNIKVPTVT